MATVRVLLLNGLKCKLWGPAFMCQDVDVAVFEKGHPGEGIPVVPYLPDRGLKTSGVPVCHTAGGVFAPRGWRERVEEVKGLYSRLEVLPQTHVQWTGIRALVDTSWVSDSHRGRDFEVRGWWR